MILFRRMPLALYADNLARRWLRRLAIRTAPRGAPGGHTGCGTPSTTQETRAMRL